jgi:hypothetical protein
VYTPFFLCGRVEQPQRARWAGSHTDHRSLYFLKKGVADTKPLRRLVGQIIHTIHKQQGRDERVSVKETDELPL